MQAVSHFYSEFGLFIMFLEFVFIVSQQKISKFHWNFLCGNLEERHNFLGFLMHETETSLSS